MNIFFPMRRTLGFLFFSARLYINLKLVHDNTFINVVICYITIDQCSVHVRGIRELFLITVTIMLLHIVIRLCLNDLSLKAV